MSYHTTLKGWLVTFIYAAARETDERIGSSYAAAIVADVARHSPITAFEWTFTELRNQVTAILAKGPDHG